MLGSVFHAAGGISRLGNVDEATRDLVLAADGDPAAFERFVRETESDVRRFIWWWGRPGAELDDLVQETFLRAFRGISTFRGESPGRSWLISIARRACADHAAKCARHERSVAAVANRSDAAESADHVVGVADVIRSLADNQREAFVLVRVLGYSYDEAAAMIGCPRGTVQSRVARARMRLSEALSEETLGQGELAG